METQKQQQTPQPQGAETQDEEQRSQKVQDVKRSLLLEAFKEALGMK